MVRPCLLRRLDLLKRHSFRAERKYLPCSTCVQRENNSPSWLELLLVFDDGRFLLTQRPASEEKADGARASLVVNAPLVRTKATINSANGTRYA